MVLILPSARRIVDVVGLTYCPDGVRGSIIAYCSISYRFILWKDCLRDISFIRVIIANIFLFVGMTYGRKRIKMHAARHTASKFLTASGSGYLLPTSTTGYHNPSGNSVVTMVVLYICLGRLP